MKTKIKEFIEKYRKQIVLVLTLVVFAGILSVSIMSKNNKDEQKDSSINTGEEVGVDKISQNEVFELFKGVTANIEQKNATQSPSNLPKVIWEGLVAQYGIYFGVS